MKKIDVDLGGFCRANKARRGYKLGRRQSKGGTSRELEEDTMDTEGNLVAMDSRKLCDREETFVKVRDDEYPLEM